MSDDGKVKIVECNSDQWEFIDSVKYGVEQERSRPEWSGITPEWMGFDNKMENNLGLSSCAVPQSAVVCAVAYFRRNELLSGVSERNGID